MSAFWRGGAAMVLSLVDLALLYVLIHVFKMEWRWAFALVVFMGLNMMTLKLLEKDES